MRCCFILDYSTVSLLTGLNAVIYLSITLSLDFLLFLKQQDTIDSVFLPPRWESLPVFLSILFTTNYFWLLFLAIPLSVFFNHGLFYSLQVFPPLEPYTTCVQLSGLLIVSLATFIACWGRISRWTRAIPWGNPVKLETEGMYHWIRHPLYTSYFLFFAGFVLVFQSLLVIPLLIGIPGYYRHSLYEEKLLIEEFGDQYQKYRESTGRFFPRIIKRN